MITLSASAFWSLVVSVATVTAVIVLYSTKFQTKKSCRLMHEQELAHRAEIWHKVDQMYEWMITGVIKIRRGDTEPIRRQ